MLWNFMENRSVAPRKINSRLMNLLIGYKTTPNSFKKDITNYGLSLLENFRMEYIILSRKTPHTFMQSYIPNKIPKEA